MKISTLIEVVLILFSAIALLFAYALMKADPLGSFLLYVLAAALMYLFMQLKRENRRLDWEESHRHWPWK